jgi:hypothetical protein
MHQLYAKYLVVTGVNQCCQIVVYSGIFYLDTLTIKVVTEFSLILILGYVFAVL